MRNQDDSLRLRDSLHHFDPPPSGPSELRQIVGQCKTVRSAWHGNQSVVRQAKSRFEKLLEMRLIAGVAAMNDEGLGFATSAMR